LGLSEAAAAGGGLTASRHVRASTDDARRVLGDTCSMSALNLLPLALPAHTDSTRPTRA
jgi:hypothetical protein